MLSLGGPEPCENLRQLIHAIEKNIAFHACVLSTHANPLVSHDVAAASAELFFDVSHLM